MRRLVSSHCCDLCASTTLHAPSRAEHLRDAYRMKAPAKDLEEVVKIVKAVLKESATPSGEPCCKAHFGVLKLDLAKRGQYCGSRRVGLSASATGRRDARRGGRRRCGNGAFSVIVAHAIHQPLHDLNALRASHKGHAAAQDVGEARLG